MTGKIFGIGLSRTGTTSLNMALIQLGYKSVHYPPAPLLRELLQNYDAATDTPVADCFEELDKYYPNSQFILTVRDQYSWLKSMERLLSGPIPEEEWRKKEMRSLYGTIHFDARLLTIAYARYLNRVQKYFWDRPLLIMNIIAGDEWAKLCPFLNKPIPSIPFPRLSYTGSAASSLPEGYWRGGNFKDKHA